MTKYYPMKRRRAWLLLILLIPAGWWLYHYLTPQSRIVYASRRYGGRSEIFSMHADGSDVKQLTWPTENQGKAPLTHPPMLPGHQPLSDHSLPAVSPDGKLIAYIDESFGSPEIWVMEADGQRKHRIPVQHTSAGSIGRPAFSADSKKIYFRAGSLHQVGLIRNSFIGAVYRVNLDGSEERLISTKYNNSLACSPVGNMLVYDSYRPGKSTEIYRADAEGKHEVQLTHNTSFKMAPAISPDGKSIIFASEIRGIFQLFLMDTQGGNVRQLTHEALCANLPSFSPDGQQIAYVIEDDNDQCMDICTIHLDGSGRKALTHNINALTLRKQLSRLGLLADWLHLTGPVLDWLPAWGPIPRR